ncbi:MULTISPECIES: transcription repressor NadR [Romboutsia]|uniref:transcription repressor NadR n=2 Tax=Peptostreptococcaceae TaxID=186804 RepID=UPI001FA75EC0|nr:MULTISPECIES: transcription repressor NadR [Romboutsia]MDB8805939.1 transcription repressor NadR [Romboutsia sp. 1001216sp1]MDB8807617.1 transcription repressor NadR [Romboutsia sp. 1001216sp1]
MKRGIKMTGSDRRDKILNLLKNKNKAVSGSKLSSELNVSRQVIVGDVALLRASGIHIISTPRGYILNDNKEDNYIIKTIACKHDKEDIEDELNTIVDEGGIVEDVIVEHSIYGQIIGNLHLECRRDVKEFIEKLNSKETSPLSHLTDGVHLHTIKCKDEKTYKQVITSLTEKGYLY